MTQPEHQNACDDGQIQLGPQRFLPCFLAPLSGITDGPCRRIAREEGVPMVVSEMIASEAVIADHRDARKLPDWQGERAPLMVQLAGTEPAIIAQAAALVEQRGADIIDLNFGCPARRVVKKASGSALMREPELCSQIFVATVRAVSIPVTVKMRLGWDEESLNAPEIAQRAEAAGVQMITVHGRTRCQFYDGDARPQLVAPVAEAVRIPLIVNGDIDDLASARQARQAAGAVGVMVGRAAVGNPWLVTAIAAHLAGRSLPPQPSVQRVLACARRHLDYLRADSRFTGRPPELLVRNFRKHLLGYLAQLSADSGSIAQIMSMNQPDAVDQALQNWEPVAISA